MTATVTTLPVVRLNRHEGAQVDTLLAAVPLGADNALCAGDIWRRFGFWTLITARRRLTLMAEAGTINRRQIPGNTGPDAFRWVYWRDAD